jgi:hypothetical protein
LLAQRSPRALNLKLGGGARTKPGSTRSMRLKSAMELRFLRGQSRAARQQDPSPSEFASTIPSPVKPRPPVDGGAADAGGRCLDMRDEDPEMQDGNVVILEDEEVYPPPLKKAALTKQPQQQQPQQVYLYSEFGPGANNYDIVTTNEEVQKMCDSLGAMTFVAPSNGWCGFDCLCFCLNEIGDVDETWSPKDVRGKLGQLYCSYEDALLAYSTKFLNLDKAQRKASLKELRDRRALHKASFAPSSLPRQYWLNSLDMKCLALDWGVSIFVVSMEAKKVQVSKYLWSVQSPGVVDVDLKKMGTVSKSNLSLN